MADDAAAKTIDPDLEVILSLLQGAVVPAVTALSVLSNSAAVTRAAGQSKREPREDARAARQVVLRMAGALDEADILLRWTNEFLVEHHFAHAQVWPVGINGMRLSEEAFERYMEIVNRCCVLIRRADRDGMELSGYAQAFQAANLLGKDAPTQWQRDLQQTQQMQDKVIKAHVFGEKMRLLKISIRMCRDVLGKFQQVLEAQDGPPPSIMPRQTGRPA